jgi:ArsR family transcriptional regulator
MAEVVDIFKALSDEVRLRIVRAVFGAELSVAELVSVLGLPQSTVSRHLKPLREAGLVDSRREGTSVFYRRGVALNDASLASVLERRWMEVGGSAEDAASVRRVLDARRKRSREFFDSVAGSYGTLTEPGGGWKALATALAAGFDGKDVADLGAGEGVLTLLLSRYARMVTAVDQSPRMLRLVEERAAEAGLGERVRVAEGDLEQLPLPDASFDAVFLSQALHHAGRPGQAVSEAARILRAGGLLVVLDLAAHEQEWLRDEWADVWMGFSDEDLSKWMASAGITRLSSERLAGSMAELTVLVVVGRK